MSGDGAMVDNEFIKKEFEKYKLWIRKKEELIKKYDNLSEELYSIQAINYSATSIKKLRDHKKAELYKIDLIQRKAEVEKKMEEIDNHINYLKMLTNHLIGLERTFIVSHYFEGLSHSDLAEEFNYSRRTIGYTIDRGFKRIAEELEDK